MRELSGRKVNEEDLETMSTLYFDKVFTRLPVQSEASISPKSPQHQQGHNYLHMGGTSNSNGTQSDTKSTSSDGATTYLKNLTTPINTNSDRHQHRHNDAEVDAVSNMFDGFSYISRKMMYPGASSYGQSYGASSMHTYLGKSPKPSPSPSPPNRNGGIFHMSPGSSPKGDDANMASLDNECQSKSSYNNANVSSQHEHTAKSQSDFTNGDNDDDLANKSFEKDQMNPMAKPWETSRDDSFCSAAKTVQAQRGI